MFIGYRSRLPIFLFLFLLVFVSSFSNDNHTVRPATQKENVYNDKLWNRQENIDSTFLEKWITIREERIKSVDTFNLYIIAAEGGGIRAAYWTGSVLAKFNELDSNFYNQTFAISTVSGSSVGAAFMNALYKDFIINPDLSKRLSADALLPLLKKMLGEEDHLSGVTAALLFPDLIQRFIPLKIPIWDRARWLEDSWARSYKTYTRLDKQKDGLETLNESFFELYRNDDSLKLPSLFFNSTVSETGQKSVMSNLILTTNKTKGHFNDVLDFKSYVRCPVALKTAASISARFPLITPAATITDTIHNIPGAHFVDGGYFENTGLSTAMEILYMVNSVTDPNKPNKNISPEIKRKIRPVIIFIKNGDYDGDSIYFEKEKCNPPKNKAKPISNMYEARVIISTFLNAWERGGVNTSRNVERIVNRMVPKVKLVMVELEREKIVPLGWYLSEDASKYIDDQVGTRLEDLFKVKIKPKRK